MIDSLDPDRARILRGVLEPDTQKRWTIKRILNDEWIKKVEVCCQRGTLHHRYCRVPSHPYSIIRNGAVGVNKGILNPNAHLNNHRINGISQSALFPAPAPSSPSSASNPPVNIPSINEPKEEVKKDDDMNGLSNGNDSIIKSTLTPRPAVDLPPSPEMSRALDEIIQQNENTISTSLGKGNEVDNTTSPHDSGIAKSNEISTTQQVATAAKI